MKHKSDPKRNPFQISFLKLFGADFGRFSDGFGKVLGMILEAWRSILKDVGRFSETTGNNTTPQEKQHAVGERSERASAASEASGAIEGVERIFSRIFQGDSRKPQKRTRHAGETKITKRASRSLT